MIAPNDEGLGARDAEFPEADHNPHRNYSIDDGNGKAFATMQAKAEQCGCTLHDLADGYLVGHWQYSRALPCLRTVGNMLRQIGGR